MMFETAEKRVLEWRGIPTVCQYNGKKWVIHENTSLFWCFMRCGMLNLPEKNRDVV
jgi:hypothetical protein